MADKAPLAASLLNGSAGGFAGFATSRFFEKYPRAAQAFGVDAFAAWKANLTERLHELAVAIDLQSPDLFVAAVHWSRESFAARDISEESLRASLECLFEVLAGDLPESARGAVSEFGNRGLAAFEQPLAPAPTLTSAVPHERLALEYIESCLSGDVRRAADLVLTAVDDGLPIPVAYFEVLAPAQREVGRLWHLGRLGIHEEHVVTATTQSLLSVLLDRARPRQAVDRLVVGAAVGDNQHELGIRMVMDLFAMEGWRSLSLGGRLPAADLGRAVHDFQADLLVLSATLITHIVAVRDAIVAARQHSPDLKVMVGGLAFQIDPEVWRRVGADGYSPDVGDAVAVGAKLSRIPGG